MQETEKVITVNRKAFGRKQGIVHMIQQSVNKEETRMFFRKAQIKNLFLTLLLFSLFFSKYIPVAASLLYTVLLNKDGNLNFLEFKNNGRNQRDEMRQIIV